ncbi:Ulp1 protease family, C-terminal catalytic domain [Sesbania bispinosa]|nr:Ulp1 protease family, C-terminal catalytic domain [Sesbania bispinosa]
MAIVLHHEVVDDRNWEEIRQITHNKRCLPVRTAKIVASQNPVYITQGLSKKSISCALKCLYQYCTHRPDGKFSRQSIMINMFVLYLTRLDCHTMAPTEWVSNIVISFAGKFMIEEQRRVHGTVTRHMLQTEFMIFAPTLFENHWSCYVLDYGEKKLYVLDSLARVHSFAKKCLDEDDVNLEILYAEVPEQPNLYDCGVYVLKFMELWEPKKEMPYFKYEQILKFHQEYICDWVRHPGNEVRETVLKGAKVWGKLR